VYNILEKCGQLENYWKKCNIEYDAAKPSDDKEQSGGHSSPGRLLVIAEKLISRADKILKQSHSIPECVLGATMALDAQELLGFRTPTTSLEAIALRHQLEVKAECQFYGVEYNIDVKKRIQEIKKEVRCASLWFSSKMQERASLDAEMMIITQIMRIFREVGQFDEEQVCMNYLRKLHRQYSAQQSGWKGFLARLIYPIRWYIESLIRSFPLFISALIFWPLLFGIGRWIIKNNGGFEKVKTFIDYLTDSFIVFFGMQPSSFPQGVVAHISVVLLILGGFIHLGIFISYLYTLITRR
jgi:hypothetical protein